MDVSTKPSTITSEALPSLTLSNYGKRDLSWDGQRNEKHQKYVTEKIQADEQHDHPGIIQHQAEISSYNVDQTFKVHEQTYIFDSTDCCYCPKWDIPLQHEQNQDRN